MVKCYLKAVQFNYYRTTTKTVTILLKYSRKNVKYVEKLLYYNINLVVCVSVCLVVLFLVCV